MDFRIKKKGQEEGGGGFSTAIWLIILVVGVIIIAPLIYREVAFSSELGESTACYTSIIGSMFSSETTTTKCPVTDYKIFSNKVEETKEGTTKKSDIIKDFTATDDKINELFAKSIGNCLQTGGGVNSKAFSRSWLTSKTVCLECFNIEFDREIAKDSFSGLREYLEKNKVPGNDKKYADFLTKDEEHKESWINYGADDSKNLLPGKYSTPIEKKEIYTIFFIGIKQGTLPAVAFERNLFDREDTYFVYATTQDKANKICDRIVN